jgi:hypothetical protein
MTETFGGRSGLFTLLPDADPTATGIEVALRRVSTNYFAAMGIPVQQGRAFGPQALSRE